MKKITSIILALTMLLALSTNCFATVGMGAGTGVVVDGVDLTDYTEIILNGQTGDVTIAADQKVILTWDSGDTSKVNALESNPIIAIFTNETPNPGNYFEHSIIVEAGAKVVLNGVNIRTADGEEALIINDLGAYTTDTYIYVADGTRNWLTGQSGIGFSGTKTWGNNLHIEGGGFLHATATEWGFPAIGPNGMEDSMFDVTINVGYLRATPNKNAAGIGGGYDWRGFGDIVIKGGRVHAYSGGNAASIGNGANGDTGSITIMGGDVSCFNQPWTGAYHAMGAGSYSGNCGQITIYNDATVKSPLLVEGKYEEGVKTGLKASKVAYIDNMDVETLAEVNAMDKDELTITLDGSNKTMNAGFTFTALEPAATVEDTDRRYYHADFVVKADKVVPADALTLVGSYDAYEEGKWVGLSSSSDIPASTEVRLIKTMIEGAIGSANSTGSVTYEYLCESVKNFNCGLIANDPAALAGTKITVELRLYETYFEGEERKENGNYEVVSSTTYTFPAVAE